MDKTIEVKYAGVVVGRSAIIRDLDSRGLFLGITEPLPVGTSVVLRVGDRSDAEDVEARIESVSESQDLTTAGMRVQFADPRKAALFGTPGQPPVTPAAATATASSTTTTAAGDPGLAPPVASSSSPPSSSPPAVESAPEPPGSEAAGDDNGEALPEGGDNDRIPAPDPTAFSSGGGGRKGRRNRRR